MFMRRPRLFISYRHQEQHDRYAAEHYSERHRTWVNDFAQGLVSWNVDVIWDGRLQQMLKPYTIVDPSEVAFLAELSTLCLQVTQTFMPIITRGYLERATATRGSMEYGTVTEEWSHGIAERAANRTEIVTIVREWPIPGYPEVPAPIADSDGWDFRFVAANRDEVEFLGDRLHGVWEIERPRFDLPFQDWIAAYLRFCILALNMPWPGIEHWDCNFARPRVFLEELAPLWVPQSGPKDVGSQRDVNEWSHEWFPHSQAVPMDINDPRVDPEIKQQILNMSKDPLPDPELMRQNEEIMKKEIGAAMRKIIGRRHQPFNFGERAPGGRASDGLYFGPTLRSFSYLHPADPRLAELQD